MSAIDDMAEAGGATSPASVKIWDPFVRVFHWSLAALFLLAYATGDEIEGVHIAAGYTIGGLVAARIIWGLIGPPHARFSTFVRPPGEILAYLRDAIRFKAPRHLGHNPAGGAMVVALLVMLAATSMAGYMLTTDAMAETKWIEELHEIFANLTMGLVVVHVLGVIFASFEHRENLVKSMITGRKRA
jgi:cytochrome b